MLLIGIVGKMHAGKDTVASNIHQYLNRQAASEYVPYLRIGFADSLKSEICIAINTVNALYGKPHKEPITPAFIEKYKEHFRKILQGWGTDFRRTFYGNDYWTDMMLQRIKTFNPRIGCLVIPDVRFKNEAKLLHSLGGWVVRVQRAPQNVVVDRHISEQEMDEIIADYTIDNDATLEHLNVKTAHLLSTIIEQDIIRKKNYAHTSKL